MILYHNPRCGTSRKALQYLEEKGLTPEVRLYLKDSFTASELKEVVGLLGVSPIELVRKNEQVYKDEIKGKELSDETLLQLMLENPRLIQRAILVHKGKAIIARPVEAMEEIL